MHRWRVCLKMFRRNAQQRRAASSEVVESIVLSTIMLIRFLMHLGEIYGKFIELLSHVEFDLTNGEPA